MEEKSVILRVREQESVRELQEILNKLNGITSLLGEDNLTLSDALAMQKQQDLNEVKQEKTPKENDTQSPSTSPKAKAQDTTTVVDKFTFHTH